MTEAEAESRIGYCELHCQTERALFKGVHVNEMIELAGNPVGWLKVPDDSCCCDSAILAKALKVKTMFEALKHAAQCYRKERFQRLLNNLNAICLQNSCNC